MSKQEQVAIDQRAVEAAKLERMGTLGIFQAGVKYLDMYAEGWSQRAIAEQVSAAGFKISDRTVGRRLASLAECDAASQPSTETLELFAEAYASMNHPEGVGGGGGKKETDPLSDWLHATATLLETNKAEGVGYAVSLLSLPVREVVHDHIHQKEGVDE